MNNAVRICLFTVFMVLSGNVYADQDPSHLIETKDTKIQFTRNNENLYVHILGKFSNKSQYPVHDIVVEVQFLDKNGGLMDVISENLYSTVVPAKNEAAFKIQDFAINPEDHYKNYKINILSAEEDKPCAKKNNFTDDPWIETLISWFPFLILIAVWGFLTSRYSGKNSPQKKILLLIEEQNKLFEQLNTHLKQIAGSVKNRER